MNKCLLVCKKCGWNVEGHGSAYYSCPECYEKELYFVDGTEEELIEYLNEIRVAYKKPKEEE